MSQYNRRDFIKASIGATVVWPTAGVAPFISPTVEASAGLPIRTRGPFMLDASAAPPPLLKGHLRMGTSRHPNGRELTADSRSLLLDGQPWLPVMGEFHYTRYPEAEWRDELLKMKAGGIDIVASYVFWIHHEEQEGSFDWSGRRSLRHFVELCSQVGLPIVVRCGPWCHGEVRNGGLPDWLLKKGFPVRSDDAGYLEKVRMLYGEIAGQIKGRLWKDGGPVVGIQLENEYQGPAEHLLTLKRIARDAGMDVPLYTRTGWPDLRTPMPVGEMIPLFGSYAEGFWDRVITPMPGKYGAGFLFRLSRTDSSIAFDQLGPRADKDKEDINSYPYFCCEIGGGMMSSYHRRIRIMPEDIESVSMVKLGSGNNLQGYYMYHGGTNPEGRLSPLQESQATGYWNDLPVKSYDFQAPLGEFGQMHKHYHSLRRMHLFFRDFGASLATMPAYLPEKLPANASDTATLRWSTRTDGHRGYIFVNNYQRLQPMPPKEGTQFQVKLRDSQLRVPAEPFTVPADSIFCWPFNLDLGGAKLIYATAQLVCQVAHRDTHYTVFAQTSGIPTEFVFDGQGLTIESATGKIANAAGRINVRQVRPGTGAAIRMRTAAGQRLCIVLLTGDQSLACWKGPWSGREHIFLTHAGLILDGDQMRLSATDPADLTVATLPALSSLTIDGSKVTQKNDGLFRRFIPPPPKLTRVQATFEQVQAAGPARQIVNGQAGVAEAPSDAEFAQAAVWRVKLPERTDPSRNLLLRFRYVGDVARIYLDGKMLTDDFYNGNAFEFGLRRYAPDVYRKELLLKILPLRQGTPIYLAKEAWPNFGNATSALSLTAVEVIEHHEVVLQAK